MRVFAIDRVPCFSVSSTCLFIFPETQTGDFTVACFIHWTCSMEVDETRPSSPVSTPLGGDGLAFVAALVQRALSDAARALKDGQPDEAIKRCTEALEGEALCGATRVDVLATILAARSAAHAALPAAELALEDARASVRTHATAQARTRKRCKCLPMAHSPAVVCCSSPVTDCTSHTRAICV